MSSLRFATSNTVRKQFYHYLLPNGYVERVSRGVYRITIEEEGLRNFVLKIRKSTVLQGKKEDLRIHQELFGSEVGYLWFIF